MGNNVCTTNLKTIYHKEEDELLKENIDIVLKAYNTFCENNSELNYALLKYKVSNLITIVKNMLVDEDITIADATNIRESAKGLLI